MQPSASPPSASANSSRSLPRHRFALPLIGNAFALMRDPIGFQRRGHAEYGPLFSARVFGQTLTFVDPIGAPELLEQVVRAPVEQLSIAEAYKDLVGRIIRPEIFVDIDKQLREGFSVKHINQHLAPTAAIVPELLASHLPGPAGEIDGLGFCNDAVFHVIAHYLLGGAAAERSGQELARLLHVLESDFSVIGMLLPIETASARRRNQAFDRLLELITAEVRTRLDQAERQPDFMQFVVDDLRAETSTPTADQLRRLSLRVLGAVFAAHTNTAMSVATCLLDLLEHPDELARVQAEIDGLAAGAPLDLAALRGLVQLYRNINESLRRHSTGGIWRKACCELEIGEFRVPEGSLIGTSMGLVNLDGSRYPAPHEHRPERYEAIATDAYQSPPVGSTPLQFGAFGTGRNLCSGRALAYTMLGLVLVSLLRDYEWTLVAKPRRWFTLHTAGIERPLGPLRLGFCRR